MSDPYIAIHTLQDSHESLVNCLTFSPMAQYLATGDDSGAIRIWDPQDANLLYSIDTGSPVLCLEWNPTRLTQLFFGCQSGTAAYITGFSETVAHPIKTGVQGAHVYTIATDGNAIRLGLSIGPEVHIVSRLNDGNYATISILPAPKQLPQMIQATDQRVRARSMIFTGHGLIVSYLNHGIVCWDINSSVALWRITPNHSNRHIGSSVLSPDGRGLLVSNLESGMSLYSLDSFDLRKSYHSNVDPRNNYPLSVSFLKGGKYVTSGSHTGNVCIWHTESARVFQVLEHNGELVKYLAVGVNDGQELLATVTCSDKGTLTIWRSPYRPSLLQRLLQKGRWFEIFASDMLSQKRAQDVIILGVVGMGAFLLARFLYQGYLPHHTYSTPTEPSWTSKVISLLLYWTTTLFEFVVRLMEQQWQAVEDRTRRAVLDWLGITPANLVMETMDATALNAGKERMTTIIPDVSCLSTGISGLDTGTATVLRDFTGETVSSAVSSAVMHASRPLAETLIERCEKI